MRGARLRGAPAARPPPRGRRRTAPAPAPASLAPSASDAGAALARTRARLTQAPVPAEQQGADEPLDVRHAVAEVRRERFRVMSGRVTRSEGDCAAAGSAGGGRSARRAEGPAEGSERVRAAERIRNERVVVAFVFRNRTDAGAVLDRIVRRRARRFGVEPGRRRRRRKPFARGGPARRGSATPPGKTRRRRRTGGGAALGAVTLGEPRAAARDRLGGGGGEVVATHERVRARSASAAAVARGTAAGSRAAAARARSGRAPLGEAEARGNHRLRGGCRGPRAASGSPRAAARADAAAPAANETQSAARDRRPRGADAGHRSPLPLDVIFVSARSVSIARGPRWTPRSSAAPGRHHLRAHERGHERQPRRFVGHRSRGSRFVARAVAPVAVPQKQFLERRVARRREEMDAAGRVRRPRAALARVDAASLAVARSIPEHPPDRCASRRYAPEPASEAEKSGAESSEATRRRTRRPWRGGRGTPPPRRRTRARRVRRGELRRARDCRTDADAAEVHETRPKQDIQLARLVRRVRARSRAMARATCAADKRGAARSERGVGDAAGTRFSALFGVFLLPARAAFDVLALSLAAAAASDGYRDASLACRALRKRYAHASSSSSSASETAASRSPGRVFKDCFRFLLGPSVRRDALAPAPRQERGLRSVPLVLGRRRLGGGGEHDLHRLGARRLANVRAEHPRRRRRRAPRRARASPAR